LGDKNERIQYNGIPRHLQEIYMQLRDRDRETTEIPTTPTKDRAALFKRRAERYPIKTDKTISHDDDGVREEEEGQSDQECAHEHPLAFGSCKVEGSLVAEDELVEAVAGAAGLEGVDGGWMRQRYPRCLRRGWCSRLLCWRT
jgi:hypothetical protein